MITPLAAPNASTYLVCAGILGVCGVCSSRVFALAPTIASGISATALPIIFYLSSAISTSYGDKCATYIPPLFGKFLITTGGVLIGVQSVIFLAKMSGYTLSIAIILKIFVCAFSCLMLVVAALGNRSIT